MTSDYSYAGNELELFSHAINWKRYFADLLHPYIKGRVLEVGAGIGETTRVLATDNVTSWTCVEPDSDLANRIGGVTLSNGAQPSVIVGTIRDIEPKPAFDSVLYVDVLEHIRDDASELMEAADRLAPGGYLIVLSPAFQFAFSAFDKALGHERRYNRKTLLACIPPELELVQLMYADALGVLLSLANKLLLRKSMPTLNQVAFWDRAIIPISRVLDPIVGRSFGRSIIGVFQRPVS